ncbi:MAG TPA: chemotaxis protein CheB [Chitinophagaceae bacterium]|nr:chemotaxis protein CheB [Chitinophagaceae bacterium]
MKKPDYIVVAGASAGGVQAFCQFVADLQINAQLACFFLQHSSREGFDELLLKRIQRSTAIPCKITEDKIPVEGGHIYIARPDYHLIIKKDNTIKLAKGAYENRWRPSIDVLFRSAAIAYEQNTIGVIFTGLLNDGTSGMMSVQECGGVTIVQDPNEAEFPEMPNSVLSTIKADYCVSIQKMPGIINKIVTGPKRKKVKIPPSIITEAAISEKAATGIKVVSQIGSQSPFTCPDCGGALWEITDKGNHKYRCHTGHAYSASDLSLKQSEEQEAALWVAIRTMQERLVLLEKMKNDGSKKGMETLIVLHNNRIADLQNHIQKIKDILLSNY